MSVLGQGSRLYFNGGASQLFEFSALQDAPKHFILKRKLGINYRTEWWLYKKNM
jgi:hypothetical protein